MRITFGGEIADVNAVNNRVGYDELLSSVLVGPH